MNIIEFWRKKKNLIYWDKKPKIIFNKKSKKWFSDGKLNVAKNCIDRNLKKGLGEKKAIIFYDKSLNKTEISFNQLDNSINVFANAILDLKKRFTIKRVLIHSSASLESVVSMLTCAKLGIFHSVIFEELENKAIQARIALFKPDLIISRDHDENILRKFEIKKNKIKFLIFRKKKTKIKNCFFFNQNDLLKSFSKKNSYREKISNDYFFSLFTSGSTGVPKGVIHSTGGYLMYAKYTCKKFFGMSQNSVVLTASDAAWINGHTYSLYGPLSFGSTSIILESPNLILNYDFLKQIINEHKITIVYFPVTLIRLMKSIFINKKIKKNNIIAIGSMGEPLAPKVGEWFSKFFNRTKNSIVNTYFQTETGGIITAPKYNDLSLSIPHGSVGTDTKLTGLKIIKKNKNEIVLQNSWPGCMIALLNSKKTWKQYWSPQNYFKLFDTAQIINKNLFILGRTDDVINVRGHRLGSAEIESILLKIKEVKEVCAIGIPSNIEGNKVIIVLSSKNNIKVDKKIENNLIKFFGTYALPHKIYYIKELPKTKSGKILRRVVRNIYLNKEKNLGDLSTIMDKNIIKELSRKMKNK